MKMGVAYLVLFAVRLLPDRERGSGTGTARKAAAVIRDHAIVVGDAGLSQQGEERIREDAAVDQEQRLS